MEWDRIGMGELWVGWNGTNWDMVEWRRMCPGGMGEMGMSQDILGQLELGGWDGILGDVGFIGN